MSKAGNWIPLDKNLVQEFKFINRPFSRIEAMYSFTFDKSCDKPFSISGYSTLWGWSRNKVRRFINDVQGSGHHRDRVRTGYRHPVSFIDEGLWKGKDRIRTGSGQDKDTTNNPYNNPNNNTVTTQHKNVAEKLFKIALLRRKQNRTEKKIGDWGNTIRLMVERDGVEIEKIDPILEWYSSHWQDDFVPVIESAKSLREKWSKLLNAVARISGNRVFVAQDCSKCDYQVNHGCHNNTPNCTSFRPVEK